jgi:hypothetical protein
MRGLALLALAVVLISFGPPARATTLASCTTGCTSDASGQFLLGVDYSLPTDGHAYRWDLWSDPSHPTAMITLAAPNDVFSTALISNGDGTTSLNPFYTIPNYSWNEVVMPGHTEIFVWASPDFNFCSSPTPAGTVCSVSNSVWGDNAGLDPHVSNAITIRFTQTPIPEPAAWSLMVGGFLALGWALRRRRSVAGLPA